MRELRARVAQSNGDAEERDDGLAQLVERVAIDGFLEARRYIAHHGSPKYLCLYSTRTIDVLDSPAYRTRLGHYERAMQSRNRLLSDGVTDRTRFEGFEQVLVETGVAIARWAHVAFGVLLPCWLVIHIVRGRHLTGRS